MKWAILFCSVFLGILTTSTAFAYSSDDLVELKGGLGLRISPSFVITANHLVPSNSRTISFHEGYYTKLGFVIAKDKHEDLALIMTMKPESNSRPEAMCSQSKDTHGNFFIKEKNGTILADSGTLVSLKLMGIGTYNVMKVSKPTEGSSGSPIFDSDNSLVGIVSTGGIKNPFVGYSSCESITTFLGNLAPLLSLVTK